jgi:hypothetical protein
LALWFLAIVSKKATRLSTDFPEACGLPSTTIPQHWTSAVAVLVKMFDVCQPYVNLSTLNIRFGERMANLGYLWRLAAPSLRNPQWLARPTGPVAPRNRRVLSSALPEIPALNPVRPHPCNNFVASHLCDALMSRTSRGLVVLCCDPQVTDQEKNILIWEHAEQPDYYMGLAAPKFTENSTRWRILMFT